MTLDMLIMGASYARISLDKKGEELGVQRQNELNLKCAQQRGVDLAGRQFTDNDVSAMKPDTHRQGYEDLLTLVRAGQIKVVIVYQTSRLWRNRRERLDGIELFRKHGVNVYAVRGVDLMLGTASGRLMAGIEGEVNAWESEVKAERMRDEAAQAVQRGEPPKGPRLFGYARDGWSIVEDEAAGVREAYRMLMAGRSLRAIAQMLNERGLRPAWRPRGAERDGHQGNEWTPTSVRKMLRNPRYAALRAHAGTLHPGRWPAVLNDDPARARSAWEAAQRVLDDENRRTTTDTTRRWLGSGLYRCGVCGLTDIVQTVMSTRGSSGKPVYRCRSNAHLSRQAGRIDAIVAGVVCARLARDDAADLLVRSNLADVSALQAQREELRLRRTRIGAMLGAGILDEDQFTAANQELDKLLDPIEQQIYDADRTPILRELVKAAPEDVVPLWVSYPLDQKRAIVDVLMTVTVLPAGPGRRPFDPERAVRIDWK